MSIRVKAIAIIRHGDRVLLSFAIDPDTGQRYGRFLGGALEPGEHAREAVVRELREELGVELSDVIPLGTLENSYEHQGRRHQEVIFVFAAALADRSLYERSAFAVNEAVCDGPAEWVNVSRLGEDVAVYPPELLSLVRQSGSAPTAHR